MTQKKIAYIPYGLISAATTNLQDNKVHKIIKTHTHKACPLRNLGSPLVQILKWHDEKEPRQIPERNPSSLRPKGQKQFFQTEKNKNMTQPQSTRNAKDSIFSFLLPVGLSCCIKDRVELRDGVTCGIGVEGCVVDHWQSSPATTFGGLKKWWVRETASSFSWKSYSWDKRVSFICL